jgi:predicted ATPase/DNA-binding winged helix-turn-helix (wHTH) protein
MFKTQAPSTTRYQFGQTLVLPVERTVLRDGRPVAVGARAFDVLLSLIERRQRLVTRSELLELVWPNEAVEPNNLAVQVGALRKVLGAGVIATDPGRGYRFSAVLHEDAAPVLTAGTHFVGHKSNLPETLLPLVDRQAELEALGSLVEQHRVVTITGAGGMGKTRLAQHLLKAQQSRYTHGVCWVPLEAVQHASNLPTVIAMAVGIELSGSDGVASLNAALAPLSMLIALDNAEQLLPDLASFVTGLVEAARGIRVVITSQAPLHLPAEQVYRLGALRVPDAMVSPAQAVHYGAVDLLIRRVQALDHHFSFDETQLPGAVEICRRLEGLPLAIEFAAGRIPSLGVAEVLASLDDRLRALTGRSGQAPLRQQTLAAALEWSYGLLAAREQTVFRRMAVVQGEACLAFVQQCAADDMAKSQEDGRPTRIDAWAVVEALGELVDRSLVTVSQDAVDPHQFRYRLLDSPRAFALQQLMLHGEWASMQRRHANAVADRLEKLQVLRWAGGMRIDAARRTLDPEAMDIRRALAWVLEHGETALLLKMTPTLLSRVGPLQSADSERLELAQAVRRLLEPMPLDATQLQTRVQLVYHRNAPDPAAAKAESLRTAEWARSLGDRFAEYTVHASDALRFILAGDVAAATESRNRVRALEDAAWPAIRLKPGAEVEALYLAYTRSDKQAVRRAFQRDIDLARRSGDNGNVAQSNWVDFELAVGETERAIELGLELVSRLEAERDFYGLCLASTNLAAALLVKADVRAARPHAKTAWHSAAQAGIQSFVADQLSLLASLEERHVDASLLTGYADAGYERKRLKRWPNEIRASENTIDRACAALGLAEFERLRLEGHHLPAEAIDQLAFGRSP